jgi:nicotinamidase-related amidase
MDPFTQPHYDQACLITVEVQNDFVRPSSPQAIPGSAAAAANIVAALNAWRMQGKPIVHCIRCHRDADSAELCQRSLLSQGLQLCAPGTTGARLHPDIAPHGDQDLDWDELLTGRLIAIATNEFVCWKPRWSVFHRTPLEHFLQRHELDTVVLCGCDFPNSPRASIYDASDRDFRCVLLSDATSRCNQQGLDDLRAIGVHIMSTEDWLRGPGSGRVDILPA